MGISRGAALACLLVGIGCASSAEGGPETRPARGPSEPLSVLLEPLRSGWMVEVNDTVQVAIFEILPTIGAGMAYPSAADRVEWLEPGRHALLSRSGVILQHRRQYLERVSGPLGGAPLSPVVATSRPVVVAVACACELRLEALAAADGPRELLGPWAALSAPAAVPRILESVLPPDDPEWAVARWFAGR